MSGSRLEQGQLEASQGALLLFFTNYLAILLAGGITFLLLGMWRSAPNRGQKRVRQAGIVLFLAGILIVTVPLAVTSAHTLNSTLETGRAAEEARKWLDGTSYQLLAVTVSDDLAVVTIEGSGELRPARDLANTLANALGHPVVVTLRTVPAEIIASNAP